MNGGLPVASVGTSLLSAELLQVITSLAGVIILALGGALAWFARGWKASTDSRLETAETDINNLKIESNTTKVEVADQKERFEEHQRVQHQWERAMDRAIAENTGMLRALLTSRGIPIPEFEWVEDEDRRG